MVYEQYVYEEEIPFYESELALEHAIHESSMYIDMIVIESDGDNTRDKIKSTIDRIIAAFKTFIAKCREYLSNAIKKITGRVTEAYTTYTLRDIFRNFDHLISQAQKNGLTSFTFFDVRTIYQTLNDECDEYIKLIKTFERAYIKRASPKDAEKMLKNIQSVMEKYDDKIKTVINTKKTYNIVEAKRIARMIDNSRAVKKGGFVDVVDRYETTCKDIESLTISALRSLESYAEDTGYIQNAKTLQEMIHNGCIHLQLHASECVTAILKHGVPLICQIDKIAHIKQVDTGEVTDDGIKIYAKKDTSSDDRKETRKLIESIADTSSDLGSTHIRALRKITRKNDIKDWKFTNGESPLSFDKRTPTINEIKDSVKQTAVNYAIKQATTAAISGIVNQTKSN